MITRRLSPAYAWLMLLDPAEPAAQQRRRSQLLPLGAMAVYHLVWLYHHEHNLPLGHGMKPL